VEEPSTPLPSGDERRKSATPLFTNNKKRA
jgi:hypothetical protein